MEFWFLESCSISCLTFILCLWLVYPQKRINGVSKFLDFSTHQVWSHRHLNNTFMKLFSSLQVVHMKLEIDSYRLKVKDQISTVCCNEGCRVRFFFKIRNCLCY
ncbi:unnamed protein product [Lactuca virosa]|uniref:Uncharacterized protein n=1 Tax=Lactuca virosa TaxID=75947 RepID=A0AAU9NF76_9ASTR|nr:unnamed protein product [Lactuca virosa]